MFRLFAFSDTQITISFYYQQMLLPLYHLNNCFTSSENLNYTTDDDGNLNSLLGIYLNHILDKSLFHNEIIKHRKTKQNAT